MAFCVSESVQRDTALIKVIGKWNALHKIATNKGKHKPGMVDAIVHQVCATQPLSL